MAADARGVLRAGFLTGHRTKSTLALTNQRTATGLIVGTVAGAAVGALVAGQQVHRPGVRDHSEDGMAYAVFITGGAVVGAMLGIAAGFLSAR